MKLEVLWLWCMVWPPVSPLVGADLEEFFTDFGPACRCSCCSPRHQGCDLGFQGRWRCWRECPRGCLVPVLSCDQGMCAPCGSTDRKQCFLASKSSLKKKKKRALCLNSDGLSLYIFKTFVWLSRVLVVTHRIFDTHCSEWTFSCDLWDLVPWPGIEPLPPAVGPLDHQGSPMVRSSYFWLKQ